MTGTEREKKKKKKRKRERERGGERRGRGNEKANACYGFRVDGFQVFVWILLLFSSPLYLHHPFLPVPSPHSLSLCLFSPYISLLHSFFSRVITPNLIPPRPPHFYFGDIHRRRPCLFNYLGADFSRWAYVGVVHPRDEGNLP